jgi:hypothetical protein
MDHRGSELAAKICEANVAQCNLYSLHEKRNEIRNFFCVADNRVPHMWRVVIRRA